MNRPSGEVYAAIYGSAPWHRKFRNIPEQKRLAAFGFYTATLVLCQKERNDGVMPQEQLVGVFPCSEQQREHLKRILIDAGLFEDRGDEIAVHDYLAWNSSKAEIESGRRRMSEGGRKSGQTRRNKSPKVGSEGTFGSSTEQSRDSSEEKSREEQSRAEARCPKCGQELTRGECWACGPD